MLPKKHISFEAAALKAETLCARAEYSSAEIERKLIGWGVSSSDAVKIVESLEGQGYIDNSRFAHAYVRQQAEYAGWGPRKIRMSLALKGIDRQEIVDAISEIEPEYWVSRATKIAIAKSANFKGLTDYERRVKLFKHLASRGFDSSTINKALRNLAAESDEIDD